MLDEPLLGDCEVELVGFGDEEAVNAAFAQWAQRLLTDEEKQSREGNHSARIAPEKRAFFAVEGHGSFEAYVKNQLSEINDGHDRVAAYDYFRDVIEKMKNDVEVGRHVFRVLKSFDRAPSVNMDYLTETFRDVLQHVFDTNVGADTEVQELVWSFSIFELKDWPANYPRWMDPKYKVWPADVVSNRQLMHDHLTRLRGEDANLLDPEYYEARPAEALLHQEFQELLVL